MVVTKRMNGHVTRELTACGGMLSPGGGRAARVEIIGPFPQDRSPISSHLGASEVLEILRVLALHVSIIRRSGCSAGSIV